MSDVHGLSSPQNPFGFAHGDLVVVLDENGSNHYSDPVVPINQQLSRPGDGGPVDPQHQPPNWTYPDWAPGNAYSDGRLAYEINGVAVDAQLVRLPPSLLVETTVMREGRQQQSKRRATSGQRVCFRGGVYFKREGYLQLRYQNGQVRAGVQLLKIDSQTWPNHVRQVDVLQDIESSQVQYVWWGWLPSASTQNS